MANVCTWWCRFEADSGPLKIVKGKFEIYNINAAAVGLGRSPIQTSKIVIGNQLAAQKLGH